MREIKFRAWDKETRTMLGLVHQINFLNKQLWAEGNGEHSFQCPLDKYEIMQFTGLHDKNGKEIYEGDIVRESICNGIGAIHYEDGTWGFGEDDFIANYTPIQVEVIANIYENPELLKEG